MWMRSLAMLATSSDPRLPSQTTLSLDLPDQWPASDVSRPRAVVHAVAVAEYLILHRAPPFRFARDGFCRFELVGGEVGVPLDLAGRCARFGVAEQSDRAASGAFTSSFRTTDRDSFAAGP